MDLLNHTDTLKAESEKPVDLDTALMVYNAFVYGMMVHHGGPEFQRTPTTDTLEKMLKLIQDSDDEGLAYALCEEYLSNQSTN